MDFSKRCYTVSETAKRLLLQVHQNMGKKNFRFYLFNICIPLIIGGILYYLFFPNVSFVRMADSVLPFTFDRSVFFIVIPKLVRNYIFDLLWAYSLTFALYMIVSDSQRRFQALCFLAIPVILFSEAIQLLPYISGTFDFFDIMIELLACFTAIIILYVKEKTHEKK